MVVYYFENLNYVTGVCKHSLVIALIILFAGRKKTHKGGHRHFTSEDDLAREQEKACKEREWRVCRIFHISSALILLTSIATTRQSDKQLV